MKTENVTITKWRIMGGFKISQSNFNLLCIVTVLYEMSMQNLKNRSSTVPKM